MHCVFHLKQGFGTNSVEKGLLSMFTCVVFLQVDIVSEPGATDFTCVRFLTRVFVPGVDQQSALSVELGITQGVLVFLQSLVNSIDVRLVIADPVEALGTHSAVK